MAELRELERKLASVKSLHEVVSAMRNLAAIYVRHAESALAAVRPYSEVVETALRWSMRGSGERREPDPVAELDGSSCVALVFSSDQGLCGTYNDRVVRAALAFQAERSEDVVFITIGRRGCDLLKMQHVEPVLSVGAPSSLEGIQSQISDLASAVFEAFSSAGARELFFVYNVYEGMGRFRESVRRVLPPHRDDLESARDDIFSYEPILTASPRDLLAALIEEYFYIELFRALLESLSSENGARLVAMTSAASNIDQRVVELTKEFQSVRQDMITSELLDVVNGAEALSLAARA